MLDFIGKSFKRELVAGFVIVAVIPLVIICMFLVQSFKVAFSGEQKKEAGEIQNAIHSEVIDSFGSFDLAASEIETNRKITAYIDSSDNWERKQAYAELYEATDRIREIAQVDIYNRQGICQYTTGNAPVENAMRLNWGLLQKAASHPGQISYLEYKKYGGDDVNETMLVGAKPIVEKDEIQGFIVFEIHDEHFERLFQGLYNSRDGIAVVSPYWDEIYTNEVAVKENVVEQIRSRLFDNERIESSLNGYSPYLFEIQDSGIIILFMKAELLSDSNFMSMYRIIFVFALMSLLLSLLVTRVLSNHLMAPIKQLSSAMNETEGGNLDIRIDDHREDEFGILYRDFNEMTWKLKAFTEQRIQNEKDLNEANVAMMHAQLNPHFLYNTLDTIKWCGKMHHIPQISMLATSLAKILRMSISPEKVISLRDELAFVDSYMKIQQIRFDNRFAYVCTLPEELAEVMVPKLIVQPLVENAVLHGLSECDDGSIWVTCWEAEGVLFVEVRDNGCGIDEAALDNLQSEGDNKLKGHIGFYNVNKIIRLSYGEGYGLSAQRRDGGGTSVVLRMPIVKGEENV